MRFLRKGKGLLHLQLGYVLQLKNDERGHGAVY